MEEIESMPQIVVPWLNRIPHYAAQVAASLLVIVLAVVAYQVLVRALRRMRDRGTLPTPVLIPLERVVRIVAIIAAILLVLQQFDVLADAWTTMTALLAVVGVGFIAVWSILSNAFCALVLLITRPFQIGDDIEMLPDSLRGEVIDFNLLYTILRSEDGSTIQIPNNLFFQRMFRRRRGAVTSGLDEQINRPAETDAAQDIS
jgi:small-conductance mechanosensitive channel